MLYFSFNNLNSTSTYYNYQFGTLPDFNSTSMMTPPKAKADGHDAVHVIVVIHRIRASRLVRRI